MNKKTVNCIDFILNLVILLSTIWAVGYYFVGGPDVLGSTGTGCFKYFTTDSNVLVALTAAVLLFFNIRRFKNPDAPIPKWAMILKFTGTVSVTITLLTVVFFLAPTSYLKGGWESFLFFFKDNIFALHLSTPVIAIIALIFFEKEPKFRFRDCLWGLLPTVIYSVVYLVLVVFVKIWTDWYGFTFGGKLFMIPVSIIAMYLVTLLVSWVLHLLRK